MQLSEGEQPVNRILIIDDNRAIHEDIRKILELHSRSYPALEADEALLFEDAPSGTRIRFAIDSAYQGEEGLKLLENALAEGRPYALAFVDVRMPPGWDGLETIERLWQRQSNLQVVICTAYSDYSWPEIRKRLGQSDNLLILKKPFDSIEVIQFAYALTKKWELGRDVEERLADLNRLVAARTEELEKAEEAFRLIFECSPVAILLANEQGVCLRANLACAELCGKTCGEMAGKRAAELGLAAGEAEWNAWCEELRTFGGISAREVALPGAVGGRQRRGLLWMRPVTLQGKLHKLAFWLDITDRRRMEEELETARRAAEQAARAKAEFLANMSHEIRTPLNGVLGLSSLLESKDLPEETRSLVQMIRTSGETLAKIVDDVLDLSKIESGKLELDTTPYSFRESLVWCVNLFRPKAEEKAIGLSLRVAEGIPDRLVGDPTRLRQVISNLVSNAVKFTDHGRVEVEAELGEAPPTLGMLRLRITVRDTGIGIPAEQLERLFQPFAQASASIGSRYGGTGLGLAICRRLAELMGGSVTAVSRPAQGSEFRFEFLARPAEAGEAEAREERGGAPPLRVLVAEDNPVNQVVVERILRKLGSATDVVSDGAAAIRRLEQSSYDLVLLDVQMPGMDGLEAARRIRALQGRASTLPLVALTATATTEDREACLAAGMNDYLSKPVTLEALRAVLMRWGARRAPHGSEGPQPGHAVLENW